MQYLENGELPPEPTAEEKIRIAILHMDRLIALKGEHVAIKEMRKHMAWYLKGLTGAARVKDVIMETLKRDEMVRTLHDYVEHLAMTSAPSAAEESAVLH
ncbi:tRNA-dihydrouridine synthase B [compost metagenome]